MRSIRIFLLALPFAMASSFAMTVFWFSADWPNDLLMTAINNGGVHGSDLCEIHTASIALYRITESIWSFLVGADLYNTHLRVYWTGSGLPTLAYFDAVHATKQFVSILLALFGVLGLLFIWLTGKRDPDDTRRRDLFCFVFVLSAWLAVILMRGKLHPYSLDGDLPLYVQHYTNLYGSHIARNLMALLATSEFLTIFIIPFALGITFFRGLGKLDDLFYAILIGGIVGLVLFANISAIGAWLSYHECGEGISAFR